MITLVGSSLSSVLHTRAWQQLGYKDNFMFQKKRESCAKGISFSHQGFFTADDWRNFQCNKLAETLAWRTKKRCNLVFVYAVFAVLWTTFLFSFQTIHNHSSQISGPCVLKSFLIFCFREEEEDKNDQAEGLLHFWYGFTEVVPRSFSALKGHPVQKVSLGTQHGAIITTDRQLFTFGSNKYGQLGDPTFLEACDQPNLVPSLQGAVAFIVNLFARFSPICNVNWTKTKISPSGMR